MIIYLVRHGQSFGNLQGEKKGLFLGQKDDSSLTNKGLSQAKKTAKKFLNLDGSILIFSSRVKRVVETAIKFEKIIKGKLFFDNRLNDIDYGDFERKSYFKIEKTHYHWWQNFLKDRLKTKFPNGESIFDVKKRIISFVDKIKKLDFDFLILITHMINIEIFLRLIVGDDFFNFYSRKTISNCSITSILKKNGYFVVLNYGSDQPVIDINCQSDLLNFLIKKVKYFPNYLIEKNTYSENKVFHIGNQRNNFLVKLVRIKNIIYSQRDIRINNLLKNLNFPVVRFLSIKKFNKENFLIIRKFYHGLVIEKSVNNLLESVIKEMTFWLKKIHSISINRFFLIFTKDNSFYLDKGSWLNDYIRPWFKYDLKILEKIDCQYFNLVNKLYYQMIKDYRNYQPKIGLIHNDFHLSNILFDNQTLKIKKIWDFEHAFIGDIFWDLAVTIKISFFKNKKIQDQFIDLYLNDLEEKNKKITKKIIYYYLLMMIIGSISFSYGKKNLKILRKELKNLDWFLKNKFF